MAWQMLKISTVSTIMSCCLPTMHLCSTIMLTKHRKHFWNTQKWFRHKSKPFITWMNGLALHEWIAKSLRTTRSLSLWDPPPPIQVWSKLWIPILSTRTFYSLCLPFNPGSQARIIVWFLILVCKANAEHCLLVWTKQQTIFALNQDHREVIMWRGNVILKFLNAYSHNAQSWFGITPEHFFYQQHFLAHIVVGNKEPQTGIGDIKEHI